MDYMTASTRYIPTKEVQNITNPNYVSVYLSPNFCQNTIVSYYLHFIMGKVLQMFKKTQS